MKSLSLLAAALLCAAAASAQSQPATGMGCPGAAASGPAADCPAGPRGGMAPSRAWGRDYMSGWSMMSRQERQEHHDKLRSMKDYDECKAYMDKHHDEMVARARKEGRSQPARPRRDACAALKPAKP